MKTLDLEKMPLPEVFPVNISRIKVTFRLFGQLVFSGLFLFVLMVGCYGLAGVEPQFHSLAVLMILVSAIGLWIFSLSLFQSFKYLGNASAPPLVLTEKSLQTSNFNIPWVGIKALTLRIVSNGKSSFAYVHLDVENATSLPVGDMTGVMLPCFFKSHKKRLKLPPDAVLVPLERFNLSPSDLMILLKRYWSKATGQPYQPQSVDLLYPQKKFRILRRRTKCPLCCCARVSSGHAPALGRSSTRLSR